MLNRLQPLTSYVVCSGLAFTGFGLRSIRASGVKLTEKRPYSLKCLHQPPGGLSANRKPSGAADHFRMARDPLEAQHQAEKVYKQIVRDLAFSRAAQMGTDCSQLQWRDHPVETLIASDIDAAQQAPQRQARIRFPTLGGQK